MSRADDRRAVARQRSDTHSAPQSDGGGGRERAKWRRANPRFSSRAADFIANRVPKYLGYFEGVIERNPRGDGYLIGRRVSYCDLSLFQLVAGLRYAFPRAMARLERGFPRIAALHDQIAARPNIADYLKSKRRIPFNEQGIFRHYPELDVAR